MTFCAEYGTDCITSSLKQLSTLASKAGLQETCTSFPRSVLGSPKHSPKQALLGSPKHSGYKDTYSDGLHLKLVLPSHTKRAFALAEGVTADLIALAALVPFSNESR